MESMNVTPAQIQHPRARRVAGGRREIGAKRPFGGQVKHSTQREGAPEVLGSAADRWQDRQCRAATAAMVEIRLGRRRASWRRRRLSH
jgi:hypothetical protein